MNEAKTHKQPIPFTNRLLLALLLIGLVVPTLFVCLFGLGSALVSLLREGTAQTFGTLETTLTVLALCFVYAHYSLWRLACRALKLGTKTTPTHIWVGFVLGLLVATHLLASVWIGSGAIRSWDIQSIVLTFWFQGGGYWVAALGIAPTALRLDTHQRKQKGHVSPAKP